MSKPSAQETGEQILALMRELIDKALAPVSEKLAALERTATPVPGPRGGMGPPGQDGAPGERGERGERGSDGRDAAAITVHPDIEPGRRYARGSFARCRNGFLTAFRDTEPFDYREHDFSKKSFDELGWMVIVDGVHESRQEWEGDDARVLLTEVTYSSGRKSVQRLQTKTPIYRGVWHKGDYLPGDMVTADGSIWHAPCEITPEDIAPAVNGTKWRLAVRKGLNGKSADNFVMRKP